LKLLIIGGTQFVGRHIAEAALARGDEVTLFHRGTTNPDIYPEAEHLLGNRDGGLEPLGGRRWDVVVDTCGYVPRVVRDSAQLLADNVKLYVFISSLSVHPDTRTRGQDETSPVAELPDPTIEEVNEETYGGLKVLCERAVQEELPGRALIIRPGFIVGPYDPIGRFAYWLARVAEGGDVLAPAPPEAEVQIIDARDMATWILDLSERREDGVYSATGPAEGLTMGRVLETIGWVARSDPRLVWVEPQWLLAQKVAPFTDLPFWLPGDEFAGFSSFRISRAVGSGLTFRRLEETVRDTLHWLGEAPAPSGRAGGGFEIKAGITRERESEVLAAWNQRAA
jgi:nucleoside-diphosphate-sugar epimerase